MAAEDDIKIDGRLIFEVLKNIQLRLDALDAKTVAGFKRLEDKIDTATVRLDGQLDLILQYAVRVKIDYSDLPAAIRDLARRVEALEAERGH